MRYKLTLNFPTAGNAELHIPGLGYFRNGESHEISAEQAQEFKMLRGISLGRAFKDVPGYTVEPIRAKESTTDSPEGEGTLSTEDSEETSEKSSNTSPRKSAARGGGDK